MSKKKPSIISSCPCKKCGSLEKTAKGNCKPCQYRMNTEWRKRNPDKHKTYVENWRANNVEKVKADVKLYYAKWYQENKDRIKAYNAARYQAKKAARLAGVEK